jgi:hypothetical protein
MRTHTQKKRSVSFSVSDILRYGLRLKELRLFLTELGKFYRLVKWEMSARI